MSRQQKKLYLIFQWGCEALTFLTKQALQHRIDTRSKGDGKASGKKNSASSVTSTNDQNDASSSEARLQTMLLSPLAELSAIPYPDVRQKQLDTVLHILHASGETLSHGWPLILTMIGSLGNLQLHCQHLKVQGLSYIFHQLFLCYVKNSPSAQ